MYMCSQSECAPIACARNCALARLQGDENTLWVRLLVGPAYGPVDFIVYATSPVRASRLECALPLSSTLHIGWPWALDTY